MKFAWRPAILILSWPLSTGLVELALGHPGVASANLASALLIAVFLRVRSTRRDL